MMIEELYRDGENLFERKTYSDGTVAYTNCGELHRTDGPAIMYPDGSNKYYYRGVELTKESLLKMISKEELEEFLLEQDNF